MLAGTPETNTFQGPIRRWVPNATPQPPLRGGEDALGLKPVYTRLVESAIALKDIKDSLFCISSCAEHHVKDDGDVIDLPLLLISISISIEVRCVLLEYVSVF